MQEDITQINTLATTPPEEAAKNINRSKLFDVSPDNYVELKTQLEPEAISYEYPPTAEAATAEYMKLSTQNASLMKPETGVFDYVARQGKYISHTVMETADTNQQLLDLYKKGKDSPNGLDAVDKELRDNLKVQQSQHEKENFGITGTVEKLPAQVADIGLGIAKTVKNNAAIIAGFTATGAGVGAGIGSLAGGVGAIPGAIAGAGEGLSAGFTVSMFKQGYEDTSATVFGEMDSNPELNITHQEKQNISNGVGLVSGAAYAFAGNAVVKGSPFLTKLLPQNVALTLIEKPALRAAFDILGHTASSAAIGGAGSGATELAKIVGEEIAKTDGSEAAFENVIYALADKEKQKRVLQATTEGALGLGAFALATGIPAFSKTKKGYVDLNNKITSMLGDDIIVIRDGVATLERKGGLGNAFTEKPAQPSPAEMHVKESVKVLKTQDAIHNMVEAISSTKMKNMAPSEVTAFNKILFNQTGSMKFFINDEDIAKIAKTPEEEKKFRLMMELDSTGLLASQISGSHGLNPHAFLDIAHDFPSVTDYMSLNPGGPNPEQARKLLESQQAAHVKRGEVLSNLGVDGTITPEQDAQIQQALSAVQDATQPFDEFEVNNLPVFTPTIENALNPDVVQKINTDILDARLAVVKSLKEDVAREFSTKENADFREIRKAQIDRELKEHAVALDLISRFTGKVKTSEGNKLKAQHTELGNFSPFAIDPRYLPDDVREAYQSDPNLIKRKVFAVGGLSPDEAAARLNVDTGENLIKFLANSPDRKDIIKRKEQLDIELKNQIHQATLPEMKIATEDALTNLSKVYLGTAKFMRENKWSTTKKLIKQIVLPMPSIPEINAKAVGIIGNTPIKDVNAYRFIVGERKNFRALVNHVLNLEIEQASKAQENAMFNIELAKESLIAQKAIKKKQNFIKKLNDPDLQNVLREADGKLANKPYSSAVNEILDIFNLDPSRKGLAERNSFNKFVENQVKLGNVDMTIPERFNDVKESISEYSTDQFLAIVDRLEFVVHKAKMKNKLYNKFKEKELVQTEEAIVTKARSLLDAHPEYDLKRAQLAEVNIEALNLGQVASRLLGSFSASIQNAENVALALDQEKLGEFFRELLIKRMRDAEINESLDKLAFADHFKKNIEIYGKEEFFKMFTDRVSIPEFKNYLSLGMGELPKTALLRILSYMGDPYYRAKISNYVSTKESGSVPMTPELMMKILERELTKKDAIFYQNVIANTFKSLEPKSAALHLERTGQEARMVKGAPIVFKYIEDGVEKEIMLDGGYSPGHYQHTSSDVQIEGFIERQMKKISPIFGGTNGELYGQLAAAQQTEQGRLEKRTGSTRPLDWNFNNILNSIEETFHDLHFSKVGMDNLKLLKNPILAEGIKAVVGKAKYDILWNTSIEAIGGMQAENANYYSDSTRLFNDFFSMGEKGFALTILSANISSIAVQPLSLVNLAARMGPNGSKHILQASAMIGKNIQNYEIISEFAEKLNPSIKLHENAIDDSLLQSFYNFLPGKKLFLGKYKKTANALSTIKNAQESTTDLLMSGLAKGDALAKMVQTWGAYSEFIAGDVEGFPKEKLDKMSEEERFAKAKDYVQQLALVSLTTSKKFDKTAFEKLPMMRFFNKFWTDPRSQLNTMLSLGRKGRQGYKKAKEGAKERDYTKVKEGAKMAGSALMVAALTASVTRLLEDLIRGQSNPTDDIGDIKTLEDFNDFAQRSAMYFATSIPTILASVTPFVKEGLYAYNKKTRNDYRNVSIPIMKVHSDLTTGVSALADILDMDATTDPTPQEMKALMMSAGYLTGGLPINGIYKMKKFIENSDAAQDPVKYIKDEYKRLNDNIDKYIERNKNKAEAQDYIEDLKQVQKEILTQPTNDIREVIPQDIKPVLATVLSNNDWTKFDPKTGAAGIYQFTEDKWNEIKNAHPDLGLTDNGRVSKDPAQQEKALDWSIKNNTRGLMVYDIPVDTKNLLGAHKFGFESYVSIIQAKDSDKLSKVLGKEINNPVFDNFKTVKDVKDYLNKAIKTNTN